MHRVIWSPSVVRTGRELLRGSERGGNREYPDALGVYIKQSVCSIRRRGAPPGFQVRLRRRREGNRDAGYGSGLQQKGATGAAVVFSVGIGRLRATRAWIGVGPGGARFHAFVKPQTDVRPDGGSGLAVDAQLHAERCRRDRSGNKPGSGGGGPDVDVRQSNGRDRLPAGGSAAVGSHGAGRPGRGGDGHDLTGFDQQQLDHWCGRRGGHDAERRTGFRRGK